MSELPKGWAKATIADVTLPYETTDPTRSPTTEFTYIDIGSIDNQTQTITAPKTILGSDAPSRARRVVASGDVLFSTVRTYLKNIAIVPDELHKQLTSTGIAVLRPSDAIESRYLFNFVRSDDFVTDISKAQDGALYPAVAEKVVKSAVVPLAPLPEQKRIVAKIDSLTARTTRARAELARIPALIAQYKARLLESAYSGKMVGIDSPSYRPLGTLLTGLRYGTAQKSHEVAAGIPVLRIPNISLGKVDLADLKYSELSDQDYAKLKLEVGDILVVRSNGSLELVGRPAVVSADAAGMAYAGYLIRLRSRPNEILPDFLAFILQSPQVRRKIEGGARSTSGVYNINAQELAALQIPALDLSAQAKIVRQIEVAFTWLDRISVDHTNACKLLPKFDAAILARAFRGELLPQDPNDEPAQALLEKVKTEQAAQEGEGRQPQPRVEATRKELMTLDKNLEEVLTESDGWVPAQAAFHRCGVGDGTPTEDIEELYAQLRELDTAGKLEVEAEVDGHGRKLYDRIRLRAV